MSPSLLAAHGNKTFWLAYAGVPPAQLNQFYSRDGLPEQLFGIVDLVRGMLRGGHSAHFTELMTRDFPPIEGDLAEMLLREAASSSAAEMVDLLWEHRLVEMPPDVFTRATIIFERAAWFGTPEILDCLLARRAEEQRRRHGAEGDDAVSPPLELPYDKMLQLALCAGNRATVRWVCNFRRRLAFRDARSRRAAVAPLWPLQDGQQLWFDYGHHQRLDEVDDWLVPAGCGGRETVALFLRILSTPGDAPEPPADNAEALVVPWPEFPSTHEPFYLHHMFEFIRTTSRALLARSPGGRTSP